jgi:Brp/Blh family beta-carotene 15,15'-monooxygenase
MTNYNQINKNHTVLLFLLSLSFLILKIDFQFKNVTIVCFFLIATIGISHGSLDNFKGAKLLKILKIKNKLLFYFIYIFISLVVISSWLIFPLFMLTVFLIVAAYHFGKEDTSFLQKEKKNYDELLYFLKGSVVIISPLLFHKIETVLIFQALNFNISEIIFIKNIYLYVLLTLSFSSTLFLFLKKIYK